MAAVRPTGKALDQRFTAGPFGRAALVSLTAFLVYLKTLAPSIVWGDGAELTAAAYHAGVRHPSRYPLYMLLSHFFLKACPWGAVAFRMNLFSAVWASLAVGLCYLIARRLTRWDLAAVVAALLFAFSRTFWSQAVVTEVYAFHLFWVCGVLLCALTWDSSGDRRWLLATAAAYGLAFTHHLSSVLLAPGLLALAVTALVYLAGVGYALEYDIPDIAAYYISAHLVVALWIGCSLPFLRGRLRLFWRRLEVPPARRAALTPLLGGALLLLPLGTVAANWRANDLHAETVPLEYARTALASLKPGAVVFAGGDRAYFPLLYARYVEGRRPDVALVPLSSFLCGHRGRLLQRLETQGLIVRLPECYRRARGFHEDPCALDQLVADNVQRRPV